MKLKQKSYAKINLSLDVVGIRQDGYHLIESVMQTVELCDIVKITALADTDEKKIEFTSNLFYIPSDEKNSAVKAANLFFEHCGIKGKHIKMHIDKRIPVAAGLGGSSTNGATVLQMLNKLYNTNLSVQELKEIAVKIGADVPFFIEGGTQLAEGIGEQLHKLPSIPDCFIVLAKAGRGANSKNIYAEFDKLTDKAPCTTERIVEGLNKGDLTYISQNLSNMLTAVTADFCPQIYEIIDLMKNEGAMGAMMSGSGSSVYGICSSRKVAEQIYKSIKKKDEKIELFITKPCRV